MHNQQALQKDGQTPLVTFIVTYYQLPIEMLYECLDSILALSLSSSEREIIVVDDGSKESPLGKLDKYLDSIVYVRQCNGGLSAARNRGIQMATGQYLQFVDADDYLIRAPYEHCLDVVRYQQHPDVVMFDFTDEMSDNSTDIFSTGDLQSGTAYLSQHNLQATACCYLFKRSILGTLRFTAGIYHEDEEFTPQLLLRADTLCSANAQAYFYRRRPHSITSETNKRQILKRLDDKLKVIKKLRHTADTLPTEERLALSRRVAQLTMDYIYTIIIQTRDRHFLNRKLDALKHLGLFPLPDRDYTKKYKWFRRLTNSSAGLTLLMNVLPYINKER